MKMSKLPLNKRDATLISSRVSDDNIIKTPQDSDFV